jgi:branched-chain amino acid transport system substrate-binding protein
MLALGAATVPLGMPFVARAQSAGPIRIGLSYAHAGIQGPGGPFVKAGAEVALAKHGGKVLGQTVELVDSDETDVPGTRANMKALIETHKVVAVVGGS